MPDVVDAFDNSGYPYRAIELFGEADRRLKISTRNSDGRVSLWVSSSNPTKQDGWEIILPFLQAVENVMESTVATISGTSPGRSPYWGEGKVQPRQVTIETHGDTTRLRIHNPDNASGENIEVNREHFVESISRLLTAN